MTTADDQDRLAEIDQLTAAYYENAIDEADLIRRVVAAKVEIARLVQENARLKAAVLPFTECGWKGTRIQPEQCGNCVGCRLKASVQAVAPTGGLRLT